jgi:hypothetical protein
MCWIWGETQFLGGECESKKMEFEFSHECTNVLDSGRNTRASGECEPKKMEFEFSHECTNVLYSVRNTRASGECESKKLN